MVNRNATPAVAFEREHNASSNFGLVIAGFYTSSSKHLICLEEELDSNELQAGAGIVV